MSIFCPLLIGCAITNLTTLAFGILLKRHSSIAVARAASKVSHFILIAGLLLPQWGLSYPCLESYDAALGIPSLPFGATCRVVGVSMFLVGLALMIAGMLVLLDSGDGVAAFGSTRRIADKYIYRRTRNPMALGFCVTCAAIGLMAASTFFTLWSLAVVTPTMVFYLKFFEERELEIRFGQAYLDYKRAVPFLIPNWWRPLDGIA